MKVVLAEKPSVARDIAAVVGATNKKDGYFEGNDYAVTYAFGHLVTLAEPEDMNPVWGGPWRIAQLPMIPTEWKYKIVDKTLKQFNVIKKLFSDPKADSIICATDAGREGEHIFRLIYKLSGSNKPVERLWISSLTADAIKEGLKKLRSSTEYDNLANAASARAQADWIVGLNFTRAYTSINRQLCTIGRVQTPTLNLITNRQKAIDEFKPNNFFEIIATFEPGFQARYITPGEEPQTRIQVEADAKAIFAAIKPEKKGKIVSVNTVEKRTNAPPLYDLLNLQKEANKRFGYTAQEALDIAQTLYEEYKLISYPRTESRHLASDMVQELPRVLSSVLKQSTTTQAARDAFAEEGIVPGKITAALLKPRLNKAYVDDAKLTDHHAIIPTYNDVPSSLPERQKNIYKLVATRFMTIFLPPEIRDETTAFIKILEYSFRAKGFVIKDAGWTKADPQKKEKEPEKKEKGKAGAKAKDKGDAEESQQLPPLNKGQDVDKRAEELKSGKTTPPKPYDDGSLLTAMKNIGKEMDDEDLAAYMKQRGLGTPATRAAIIERLIKSGYIERQKKAIVPTEKGKALISQVHGDLKDVALTATWEQSLADMQDGKLLLNKFENDIGEFVRRILPEVTKRTAALPRDGEESWGQCPQCKVGFVKPTPKGAGCSQWREGCNFSIWRECFGATLSDEHMKDLIKDKRTKLIKGFKKKSGEGTYDARLKVNEEFKVRLDFDP
ncbi:MAG: DNA topoisomerase 3 [Candidatus Melainabacteria bacterium]|nr:DNA topoisomerase 3 [Candidatus Melainabacteria bacterium]